MSESKGIHSEKEQVIYELLWIIHHIHPYEICWLAVGMSHKKIDSLQICFFEEKILRNGENIGYLFEMLKFIYLKFVNILINARMSYTII